VVLAGADHAGRSTAVYVWVPVGLETRIYPVVPPSGVPERVTIYRAPTTVADASEIATWLGDHVDAEVGVRGRALELLGDEELATAFARARVLDATDPETGNEMVGIVRYEERALDDPERAGGVLYDGLAVQRALRERLPDDERGLDHLHVALLDRALGTWGTDGRWHKRVAILGQPTLVSVPGLYEAPAKPEAYYREKGAQAMVTGDAPPREVLESAVDGAFLVADDPRTTEALQGYALAAVDYLRTGEPFCEEAGCRLYDAHRQPALIEAQLSDPPFCERHAAMYGG
jgi:hypothetical protein